MEPCSRSRWELLHTQPHFADAPRAATPVAERLADRLVNLLSSAQLAPAAEGDDAAA